MFIIIGHLPSPKYNCLVMHVALHIHLNAKGENQEALDMMNQMIKTYLEENSIISLKANSCKLAQ
jgi:hypothetical protein